MKNSIKIAFVVAIAVPGIAACTSGPVAENNAAPTSSTPTGTTMPPSVVTEVVTATVTNSPKLETVVNKGERPGYGSLKLGMTLGQAKATGLLGQGITEFNGASCVWNGSAEISQKNGVESIELPRDAKSSAGIGAGSTVAELKKAYPNAQESYVGYTVVLPGDGGIAFYVEGMKPIDDARKVTGIRIYSTGNTVCPHVESI